MSHNHNFNQNEWPFKESSSSQVYTTKLVVHEQYPIVFIVHDEDGDWQFLCGTTTEDIVVACFGCFYEHHKLIEQFSDLPRGWCAWRDNVNSPWFKEQQAV
ncbi:hypothetical protein H5085_09240 [Pseudoalteromonas sp. SR43-6]|uniref:hypothetical protein n=1 Tax=unclassified Pseudoalteromonas TaxID=194690 RepID=UPI0015FA57A9|nr:MULTISPECIES: hypothetical protein [unclassified Pseudoalteromonas]MBB1288366.1 hypothetical protein [Pseudoalteromonas sp. SR41-5]MBB1374503.1 hypothetical protein [Pseudoalteromonas sp. SR43-6]MBB1413299.1 hypothetical protein [Pseudoalteromonas sp. SG43-8]